MVSQATCDTKNRRIFALFKLIAFSFKKGVVLLAKSEDKMEEIYCTFPVLSLFRYVLECLEPDWSGGRWYTF